MSLTTERMRWLCVCLMIVTCTGRIAPRAVGLRGRTLQRPSAAPSLQASSQFGMKSAPSAAASQRVVAMPRRSLIAACIFPLFACLQIAVADDESALSSSSTSALAYFSGGDLRLLQPVFDDIRYLGVRETKVGELQLVDGSTMPVVEVRYDTRKVGYKRILGAFWRGVDPTRTAQQGQFGTPGPTVIWSGSDEERLLAQRPHQIHLRPRERPALSNDRVSIMIPSTECVSYQHTACVRVKPQTRQRESLRRLDASGIYRGKPIATLVRDAAGARFSASPPAEQQWYLSNPEAYKKLMDKTGRRKWLEDTFKPIKTTACEGSVCGFVYFPCTVENGCSGVMQGNWP